MAPAITTRDLRRVFDETVAVEGVDLVVESGEIYGFLGPNGAGKSTCVRMLCTLLLPSRGSATVAGHDVASEPNAVRLRIGVALQDAALDDRQDGLELLRLQARLYGLRGSEIDRRIADLTDLIDIGDAIHRRIGTYSGGMKRRLDLAAALVHNPDVLFLDEPTTGLDPVSRAKVWEEVRTLNRELGTTIFLTTQYLEEADALAERVGIIDRGSIVAEGPPATLKRQIGTDVIVVNIDGEAATACSALRGIPGVSAVDEHGEELLVHADDGSAVIGPVAVALAECGVTVRRLTLRTPTLDDVFLELTGAHIHEDEPT
ncbi:MAG: ATP-binding cassette domain-containing protein [Acidimicrobiia bacterium]|nr:ATP-binding cassette domain-containing protein [Acidimicrobiia bacterium]